jgi:flavin-dependent dehydrogenase
MTDLACDVLVVGSGPAGASAARLLALRGRRTLIVSRRGSSALRLELLASSLMPMLDALGASDLLEDHAIARPCSGIVREWGPRYEFEEYRGASEAAFVVCRQQFDRALLSRASAAGATSLVASARSVEVRASDVRAELVTEDDRTLLVRCAFIIDATGRRAAIARRLGAKRLVREQRIAHLVDETESTADDRFLHVCGRESTWWSYTIHGPASRRETWAVCRAEHPQNGRLRYDASSVRLDSAAGDRWLAVGDAAAAFDPICSQGLANAFSTALLAAEILSQGQAHALSQQYARLLAATHDHSEEQRRAVYRALEV